MPAVLIEEGEDLFECLVRDVYAGVLLFQGVDGEDAAVQVRDRSEKVAKFGTPLLAAQPVVEQLEQEGPVETEELRLGAGLLDHGESVAEIVLVLVEKALLLNEVYELEAVEHDRGVPLALVLVVNALDLLEECGMLGLEAVVESLRDTVHVECLARAGGDADEGQLLVLLDLDLQRFEFLEESLAGLAGGERVLAACDWLAMFALDPLPRLETALGVEVDDQVLTHALGELNLDLTARLVVVGSPLFRQGAEVGGHAAFLGNGIEGDCLVANLQGQRSVMIVPSEFVQEERFEVEQAKVFFGGGFIHRSSPAHSMSFLRSSALDGR